MDVNILCVRGMMVCARMVDCDVADDIDINIDVREKL